MKRKIKNPERFLDYGVNGQLAVLATIQRSRRVLRIRASSNDPDSRKECRRARSDIKAALDRLDRLPRVKGIDWTSAELFLIDVVSLRGAGLDPITIAQKLDVPLAMVLVAKRVEDELRSASGGNQ